MGNRFHAASFSPALLPAEPSGRPPDTPNPFIVFVRPGRLETCASLIFVLPNRAFKRLDFPTLLLPKKATSGKGEGGESRKCAALNNIFGGAEVKKRDAYFSCASFGGLEKV